VDRRFQSQDDQCGAKPRGACYPPAGHLSLPFRPPETVYPAPRAPIKMPFSLIFATYHCHKLTMLKPFSFFCATLMAFTTLTTGAQEELAPDVRRMQESAHAYLNRGDYANAIM